MKFNEMVYNRPDIIKQKEEILILCDEFKSAKTFEDEDSIFEKVQAIRDSFSTNQNIATIRYTIDTRDEFYSLENDFFDENSPHMESATSNFYKAFVNTKFLDKHIQKRGNHIFNLANALIKSFDDIVLLDMVDENKLSSEYVKLISSAKIPFDGKILTLSMLVPYMMSNDRNIRKEANEKYYGFMNEHLDKFDEIYDKLVKVRDKIAKKLNLENFVELGYLRMQRTDYSQNEVEAFREGVKKHIVPIVVKLKSFQKERIGVESLKYYDNNFLFKDGNAKPKGNESWMIDKALRMYSELSNETSSFIKFLVDNELMSLSSKEGKAPGGYCSFIRDYKVPFIYSNFNGTHGDVTVLTHEFGHAMQVYYNEHKEIEYTWPTSEGAEIHSMSMEYITYPWMKLFFEDETDKFFTQHISEALSFIPYAVSVDKFQHIVYSNPQMTPQMRRQVWSDIEKEFMPYIDYEDNSYLLNGGFWQKQIHIYEVPFYYIDYALAQFIAFQFLLLSKENMKKAWDNYFNLCKLGGSQPFSKIVTYANMLSPFDVNNVQNIGKRIEEYLNKLI
jgi:M3 family oligoendopeptidase